MILTNRLSRDEEGAVVARCKRGDREAFARIVEEYGDMLFGTAMLMMGDRGLAEDAVQEALLSAWKNISKFQEGRPIKPWVMKILLNEVRMYMRRKRPAIASDEHIANAAAPTEAMEAVESSDVLYSALSALSDDQREVVVLRYFADLTVPEIAKATRRREGTVKSRLHRAIERMREAMSEEAG